MLPEPVIMLLAAAFPGQPLGAFTPTEGGFSHHTVLAALGGRQCVVKAAALGRKRASLRHEAAVLRALAGHGLGAPGLLALLGDAEWTVELIEALPGQNGIRCYSQPRTALCEALGALAGLLASAHAAPLTPLPPEHTLALRAEFVLAQLPVLPLGAPLRAALAASLRHPIWRAAAPGLVHGDAGLHNLLWHRARPALIDWEWAAWGTPLFDIAWVWWALRWRGAPADTWEAFAARYHACNPAAPAADAAALRALALGQVATILVRVAGQQAAYAEWQRRAEWSLALAFPAF